MSTARPAQTEYMDLHEIATRINMSYEWVYRQAATGALPAVRFGRFWRVSKAEFQSWLGRQNPYAKNA